VIKLLLLNAFQEATEAPVPRAEKKAEAAVLRQSFFRENCDKLVTFAEFRLRAIRLSRGWHRRLACHPRRLASDQFGAARQPKHTCTATKHGSKRGCAPTTMGRARLPARRAGQPARYYLPLTRGSCITVSGRASCQSIAETDPARAVVADSPDADIRAFPLVKRTYRRQKCGCTLQSSTGPRLSRSVRKLFLFP